MTVTTRKKQLRSLMVLGLFLASFFSTAFIIGNTKSTDAVSGGDWNASRIIDDTIYFNSSTMDTGGIQNFLNLKLPSCDTNGTQPSGRSGYPTRADWGRANGAAPPYVCLKDYSQDFPSKAADAYCVGITGGTKSAANIIFDVARACGVNPQVILVVLQKEQSLVTDDWPWPIQYRSATGYGCPDSAPCDSEYYGFFNQVYNAARQSKRYVQQAHLFNYAAGRTSYVQYNPNTGCGGTNLTLQTQATAVLYNYTPYQPNQAALNSLYGTGDGCSAYGNRNFWRIFNDWFGSTYDNSPTKEGEGGGNSSSWNPGRLDVFVRGADSHMWHRWYERSWRNWDLDPPANENRIITSQVAATSWEPGRIDVFARSESGSLIHKWHLRTLGWSRWEDLGGCIQGAPTVSSWGPGRLDVFVQGCNDSGPNMFHKWYDRGWSDWEATPNLSTRITSAPSAASWGPNQIDVFSRGQDGSLIHNTYNGQWNDYTSRGGCIIGQPTVSSWGPGRLDVFVQGCNDSGPNVHHIWYDSYSWKPWELTPIYGNRRVTSLIGAVSWSKYRIDLYGRGTDGDMLHQWYDRGWGPGESLGGVLAP